MITGKKIQIIRKFRNMSQEDLGILAGYSNNTAKLKIKSIESGTYNPDKLHLVKICSALGISTCAINTLDTIYTTDTYIMETIFWLEEDLAYSKNRNKCSFIYNTACFSSLSDSTSLDKYIKDWISMRNKFLKGEISHSTYFNWKITWSPSK